MELPECGNGQGRLARLSRSASAPLERREGHPSAGLANPILTPFHDNCLSGDKGGIVAR